MNNFLVLIAVNLVALALTVGGVYMAINQIPNWGWLIGGGIVCAQGVKSIKTTKKDDNEE